MPDIKGENSNIFLVTPTVHTNGTSGDKLADDLATALKSIRSTIDVLMGDAYPHERDYYVQGQGAYAIAKRQADRRIESLRQVYAELLDIRYAVLDQMEK